MKFYLISKSDNSKYESSKSADSTTDVSVKAFGATKEVESTGDGTKESTKDFFRQRRELKRRVKQIVRYIKRALIQCEDWSLFA